jgi:uncharacterized protein YecT (DUF1311 family)
VKRFAILFVTFLPCMAVAQSPVLDAAEVAACFADTPLGEVDPACLGAASNACQTVTPGGGTTLGITECILAETAAWDGLLNREYAATRATLEPDIAAQLLTAQRAWIAFRDAECGLQYALWRDGTIRSIVAANCRMVMTARRTIDLRDMQGN